MNFHEHVPNEIDSIPELLPNETDSIPESIRKLVLNEIDDISNCAPLFLVNVSYDTGRNNPAQMIAFHSLRS